MSVRVILSVLLLVMGCSSWVAAQAVRGNPQAGQVVYEKICLGGFKFQVQRVNNDDAAA